MKFFTSEIFTEFQRVFGIIGKIFFRMITINFEDLEEALEGTAHRMSFGVGLDIYLDTTTGEIIWVCEEFPDHKEAAARIRKGPGGRYLLIDPLQSYEKFEIMEGFAEEAPKDHREELFSALRGQKPFARFNGIVHSEPNLKERWFEYRDAAYLQLARNWLKTHGIKAKLVKGEVEL